jgi:SAM-dependent methyltransferase
MQCSVCGGTTFTSHNVLWEGLINEWQLSQEEITYIDRQQGEICDGCGSNLRSIALGNAVRAYLGTADLLQDVVCSVAGRNLSILELNEAGKLTPFLKQFEGYKFAAYPEVDIHAMPYSSGTFDIIIHSDTLEHISNPIHGLAECRRVLKLGGALCFTVPIIVGRMSRDRTGLATSYHGDPSTASDDLVVQTEFGADAWTYPMRAGFTDVSMHAVAYPAAIAMVARNGWATR